MTEQGQDLFSDAQDLRTWTRNIDAIVGGFHHAQIVITAVRANVFAQLEKPAAPADVASALDWSERGVRMLLDGLVAVGLVERDGPNYRNTAAASACLIPGAPHDQTHIIAHKAAGWDNWGRLEEAVRTGAAIPRESPKRSPEDLRAFILGMADIGRMSAEMMLAAIDIAPYRRMLDIGGGPGTYSIAFVKAQPDMRATVIDLPEVLPIGREQAEIAGVSDKVTFVEGDLTTDDFGGPFDLILLSNIIHSSDAPTNQDVVRRAHAALAPGGMLIVKDFLLDSGRVGPAYGLIFALQMLLHTAAGDTYTIDDVAAWTDAAGFPPGRLVDLTPQSRLWIVERKRQP